MLVVGKIVMEINGSIGVASPKVVIYSFFFQNVEQSVIPRKKLKEGCEQDDAIRNWKIEPR